MARLVCAGLACVDMVFDAEAPLRPGAKHRARGVRAIPGGGALNAALAAAALGGAASLMAPVGRDAHAETLRRALEAAGVGVDRLCAHPEAPSSHSAVIVDPAGERTIVNHRDPRLLAMAPAVEGGFDAALADTRWPAGAAALGRAARAAGRPFVIDAEAPLAVAGEALSLATHIAFSEQGLADLAADLAHGADPRDGLRAAARRFPEAWLCVTRGPAPVLALHRGAFAEHPVFAVAPVDTLGAGDVWHGVFALALAEGRAEADAVRFASAAAALSTTGPGLSALPDRAALDALLQETAT